MKSEEGNDSLDTIIRQAIGKEPLLSFPRTGDSPVQWIQLLHALDQQDLPGWPLLSPLKIQMQKCEKCSREFCSPINYRRHIRVHRRSLNVDKESTKNRDLLGAFWDKLSLDEAKETASFKDVTLEDVPGSSIIRALTSFIRKPGFCMLPQVYVKAGSALLDIVQARPSRLPISSQELFSILDDASERTFLCAGTAESMQKFVFDGEAGKIGLEMKNLVACTSFLVEQKLVRAWLADKDAEALRCQKLLVEEEEAAQKRQAELLERKKQKKLRQKEQRAKEQAIAEKADLNVTIDTFESPPAEISSPTAAYESSSDAVDASSDHVPSLLEPVSFSNIEEDADTEAQCGISIEHSDSATCQNIERQIVQGYGRRHLVIARWQVQKPQRNGRNGFHAIQNQISKLEPARKHGAPRDLRATPAVNCNKVWTRKPKSENDGETSRTRLQGETINQTDTIKNCEVMIGSITVTLGNCTAQKLVHDRNSSVEHAMPRKNNVQEKHIKADSVQNGTSRSLVKRWRQVSRHDSGGAVPVQSGNQEFEGDVINGESNCRTLPSESCLRSSAVDSGSESGTNSHSLSEEDAQPEGLLFSSRAAKDFLAQRWKEAIMADHVKLVLSPESEPPGCPNNHDDIQVVASSSSDRKGKIPDNAENRVADAGDLEYLTTGTTKFECRLKPEKGIKIKYIPKQRTVA
ncbi:uncharacterized protein LOC132312662 isoform X2 [Cornus florida]|nr:uncharacterized protein LOC132312662 isoform X2 [Cornus florida]XP_059667109.1 uncharacterized protein LOC132312662 isoform X2 [Cornus florida]